MPVAEAVAVALAIAYLLLAVRQNIWCWAAAFLSTAIYTIVFFDAALLMETALQVFYMAMAFYGWWHWQKGAMEGPLVVQSWTRSDHTWPLAAILLLFAFLSLLAMYAINRRWARAEERA